MYMACKLTQAHLEQNGSGFMTGETATRSFRSKDNTFSDLQSPARDESNEINAHAVHVGSPFL